MKKYLLSFILSVAGIGMANAADPVMGIVCSYAGQETFFPLTDAPQVKYETKEGVQHAVVLVGGVEKLSIALVDGGTLTVSYDSRALHEHNYAEAWSSDETNHWHACTGDGECDAPKADEAAHAYGEVAIETAYYTCSVCQYENATRKAEYEDAVKAAADQAAAAAVVEKINAIGTVEYTEASKALIDEAREAYDALTDDQKALITAEQLQVLTDAETAYEDLKAAAEEAAKYATLTYNIADQGGLGVNVKKGEVILNVKAEECWTVATLTVNEEDKIADLAEGKFKFDMQDDATVAVTYKWADEENLYTESDITTGIITTKADVKAYIKDGSIYVESNGAAITLYTINGTKIAQKTPAMKTAIFTVPAGAYIVKVGNEGIKLVVE